ncbi:MAG: ATP-binding protein [Oscillospiraceae bacterium]|nr:ATP-binding protein [Oscillospiraceae bacterium]
MPKITLDATVQHLSDVQAFLDEILEAAGCPMAKLLQIQVAAEEIFINVASYAYAPDSGSVTVSAEISGDPAVFTLVFTDSGIPFNPLAQSDPDISLPVAERSIGGLGILLAKKNTNEMLYEYTDGQNILTMKKYI